MNGQKLIFAAIAVVILLVGVGLYAANSSTSRMGANVGSTAVTIESTGLSSSLKSTGETLTADVNGHSVRITGDVLTIDGREVTSLDGSEKRIEIRLLDETDVVIDGVAVTVPPAE